MVILYWRIPIVDIYNHEKLLELIRDFYNLVGIKVCIYDSDEEELVFYPKRLSSFCSLLREDKVMDERCMECDHHAFSKCKQTYKQYVYTCHAGLTECMSPIILEKKIIGYMILGQIKSDLHTSFDEIADRLPIEKREALKACYDSLPTIEIDKLNSAMRLLDACTGYEYLKGLVAISDKKIDILIAGYVNENIAKDLSVSKICDEFRISRSDVYSIFRRYFETTPADYIKTRRLVKACELLERTNLHINDVGIKCGFPDYNYFSKVFKRAYGISPREYRKSAVKK